MGTLSFKKKRHQGHGSTKGGIKKGKGSKFAINYDVKKGTGSKFAIGKTGIFADGGKMDYAEGGVVAGPAHEQGGIEVVDQQNAPVAEVEGGERIFSIEDTQAMEQAAAQIIQLAEQDQLQADEAAKQLGYQVTEMVMKQEQVNPSQEGAVPTDIGTVSEQPI